jgi:hypothetical protein
MNVTLTDTSAALELDPTEAVFLIAGLHVGLAHEGTALHLSDEARGWCLALIQHLRPLLCSTAASAPKETMP